MNELALFAGGGGGILGGKLLGWNTVGAVEIEKYPRDILLARQKDGHINRFPIWDDISTFDGRPWKGSVDIVSGGFPCQDISAAGKGAGIDGGRSGLWGEMSRVVREVSPRFVFVENSPMLTSRGLHRVLGDLAEMGYNARWCVLGADDAGAPHRRKRIWILGYSSLYGQFTTKERESFNERGNHSKTGKIETCELKRSGSSRTNEKMADPNGEGLQGAHVRETRHTSKKGLSTKCGKIAWWKEDPADIPYPGQEYGRKGDSAEVGKDQEIRSSSSIHNQSGCKRQREDNRPSKPQLGRVAHGVANRVDRLKAIGNGQVPGVAALAFVILSEGLI